MGFCELDPPGQIFSRTVVMPTTALMTRFDAHLSDFASTIATLPTGEAYEAPPVPSPVSRTQLLRVLDAYTGHWSDAIDAIFDLDRLSPARRSDAKRNLISSSHWNLLHQALVWQLEGNAGSKGILADRLAARLLELTGQSLQTTKDHIGYLIGIGIFRRMKGKALHVAVTDRALRHLEQGLAQTARELPAILGVTASGQPTQPPDTEADKTVKQRTAPTAKPKPSCILEIVEPASDRRRIEVEASLTVGRATPSDVILNSQDISRAHCRIYFDGHRLTVVDLNSTNGTFVNESPILTETVLAAGDQIRVGSYIIQYGGETFDPDATQRRPSRAVPVGLSGN
jgi:hypothetical protein